MVPRATGPERREGLVDLPAATLRWLSRGDPAIRWQVLRDVVASERSDWEAERQQVPRRGWGQRLLARQRPDGNWGAGPYQPKWTCTVYTMQLLWQLGLPRGHAAARAACRIYLEEGLERDGGMNFWRPRRRVSETCVSGMVLGQLSALGEPGDVRVERIVAYLLGEQMPDGGWNCRRAGGAVHSSFHTTISALEGLREYLDGAGPSARSVSRAATRAREFLLEHRLFKSHRTGRIVANELTHFHFPAHWHYDVLRGLDYFRSCAAPRDERLEDAIALLRSRRGRDGRWRLARGYPGAVHFELESPQRPSRWNTLRALRVLRWWHDSTGPRRGDGGLA